MDEDYKQELMVGMVQKGQASTATGACSSHGVGGSTGRKWVSKTVQTHIGSCWATFDKCKGGVFGIAEDGARFGQPAKEMQSYSFWSAEKKCSSWLPPQET